jgi:hypothetical protein
MVVIDAEKHHLDYKRSARENGIKELKEKYQDGGGASTLISRSSSETRVPERKARTAGKGGAIDPVTGKKMYEETGASYIDKKGRTVVRTESSTRMAETDNAYTLSSGTAMEAIYADHANRLKSLANTARKSMIQTPRLERSPSAAVQYSEEVASLNAKLNVARKNRPLERQAQIVANAQVQMKRQANPNITPEQIKKAEGQALQAARARIGARKIRVDITPTEWEAIQSGAISDSKLSQILDNADLDQIKQYATPRTATVMTPSTMARAKAMLSGGATQAEIASALGVPISTLNAGLSREES